MSIKNKRNGVKLSKVVKDARTARVLKRLFGRGCLAIKLSLSSKSARCEASNWIPFRTSTNVAVLGARTKFLI